MSLVLSGKTDQDLKDILIDLMAKVPGKNKKIFAKVTKTDDDFFYLGTTEFDGQTVLFEANAWKFHLSGKPAYSFRIVPLDTYSYENSRELENVFGNLNNLKNDYTMTNETRKKLVKYNAYDSQKYADDGNEYSFFYHKFTNIETPRVHEFVYALTDIEADMEEYQIKSSKDNINLTDLTPAEIKRAEQTGPEIELEHNLTPEQEDTFVKKVTAIFLHDVAKVQQRLPEKSKSHFFDCNCFFEDEDDDDTSLYGPILYAGKDYIPAIEFTDTVSDNHECQVSLYDKNEKQIGADKIRILCDTYELHYGLLKTAEKENKDLIAKLNKRYNDDDLAIFNDAKIKAEVDKIFHIDLNNFSD